MRIWQRLFSGTTHLAENLVRELRDVYPAAMVPLTTPRAHSMREAGIRRLLQAVAERQAERPIGLFQRIVFARAFQRSLKVNGYPADFNREITIKLLVHLSLGGKAAAGPHS